LTVVVAIARDCWFAHVKLEVNCNNRGMLHTESQSTHNIQYGKHGQCHTFTTSAGRPSCCGNVSATASKLPAVFSSCCSGSVGSFCCCC
jgi:hypothetical protein